MNNSGYLSICGGCMFSGKTSWLLQQYKKYLYIGKKISVVNFDQDKRYHDSLLSTHDKVMIPCIQARKLTDVYEQMQLGFVMFINALIGLIPVPLIPGLIRTSNNILFQMFKTSDKILEFKEIIDISRLLLVKNPAINRILENKDIDMDKFHQNKDLMIEKVAESAKKAFEEIPIKVRYEG